MKLICGIVGYPLKKPRSISIWKKYFKRKKIYSEMNKYEIQPKNLKTFVQFIKNEKNFKATAISMPFKKKLIKYVDKLDNFAKKSKSINLIVKNRKILKGYNTDVFGAFETIKMHLSNYKEIVVIGMGGTGTSIFNFLQSKYPKKKFFVVSKKFKISKKNVFVIRNTNNKMFEKKKFIINCTPLGSNLKKSYLKLSPIPKTYFKRFNKKSLIFDVIYDPKQTLLGKLARLNNIKFLNGLKMNTLQAKQALKIVFKK